MRISRRELLKGAGGAGLLLLGSEALAGRPSARDVKLPAGGVMPTRELGRTGERVSLVGLGGYHIGTQDDEQESLRIIREAIDHGVTFLDNCWDYNEGESERRMGKALRDGYRQKVLLMTKIDGRDRASAEAQLEQSLRRLQVETIDLVQIHEVIRMEDAERSFGSRGCMEALIAARKAGKLRFIGFTGHKDPSMHLHMLRTALRNGFTFDAVQLPLNLMDHHFRSFEAKVLPVLRKHRIAVLGMKALGSGDLLDSGVASAEECLQYAMSLPTSVVITGCDSRGVLRQALRAGYTFRPPTEEKLAKLRARSARLAANGRYELFKTSDRFDGTARNPHWLDSARL